jgi:hypothetical protein
MKSVAIVGGGPTRKQAPWSDLAWDIWTFNEAMSKTAQRSEAVFQIHDPGVYRTMLSAPEHWPWLQKYHGIKIYMQKVDPLVPDSIEYPLDELKQLLSHCVQKGKNSRELTPVEIETSTVCYAIALAILQNYSRIKIYGVEMIHTEEYRYQREGYAFWVGYAAGRGIDVEIYGSDSIFQRPLYGYEIVKEFQTMQFTIAERLHLLGIMPDKGNLVTMKVIEELKDKLAFTEEDIIAVELVTSHPDQNHPEIEVYNWNHDRDADYLKEIEIGEATRKILQGVFEILDKNSAFTPPLIKIYQRFSFE